MNFFFSTLHFFLALIITHKLALDNPLIRYVPKKNPFYSFNYYFFQMFHMHMDILFELSNLLYCCILLWKFLPSNLPCPPWQLNLIQLVTYIASSRPNPSPKNIQVPLFISIAWCSSWTSLSLSLSTPSHHLSDTLIDQYQNTAMSTWLRYHKTIPVIRQHLAHTHS